MRKKEQFTEPAGVVRDLHDGVYVAIENLLLLGETILAGPSPAGAMECAIIVERRSTGS